VHKSDCFNYINLESKEENKNRLKPAFWNEDKINKKENSDGKNFISVLKIYAVDDLRLIASISSLLADMKISVHTINRVKEKSDGSVILNVSVSAKDVEQLNHIINRLKTVKNITGAGRIG